MGDGRLEALALSEAGRRALENRAKRRGTARGLALRARIVLACADGGPGTAVAARLVRAGSSQPGPLTRYGPPPLVRSAAASVRN